MAFGRGVGATPPPPAEERRRGPPSSAGGREERLDAPHASAEDIDTAGRGGERKDDRSDSDPPPSGGVARPRRRSRGFRIAEFSRNSSPSKIPRPQRRRRPMRTFDSVRMLEEVGWGKTCV